MNLEWERAQQAISRILFTSSELGIDRKHRYFSGECNLGKSYWEGERGSGAATKSPKTREWTC